MSEENSSQYQLSPHPDGAADRDKTTAALARAFRPEKSPAAVL
jgi:hypothetical protein